MRVLPIDVVCMGLWRAGTFNIGFYVVCGFAVKYRRLHLYVA